MVKEVHPPLFTPVSPANASSKPLLSKEAFVLNKRITGLDPNKPILEQNEVVLTYIDGEETKRVPSKHGVVVIFEIKGQHFVLGVPTRNPESNIDELKASIGGTHEANTTASLWQSLENELGNETNQRFSLEKFELSDTYVCHREPNWGEWSVCFIKVAALSRKYTLEELISTLKAINAKSKDFQYGIYELEQVVEAAGKTIGEAEGPDKEQTELMNYLTGISESWVIFDDNAIARLFTGINIKMMFPDTSAAQATASASPQYRMC